MKDRIKHAQRTISKLVVMIDSGEQNSVTSRAMAQQAMMDLEMIYQEHKERIEKLQEF